ncbi:hypothetical protein AcW1_008177 [Taiwanofungus camphoratus]|nr:hypothetical protein AcW1_008177 [Antrodia cinnamomea]
MQGALADSPVVSVGALGRRNDVTGAPRADVMPVSTALFRSRPRPWTLQLPTTILPFITTTTTTTSQVMAALTSRSALRSVAAFSRPTAACTPRFSSSVHGNDPHVLETEKHRNLSKNQHKTSTTIPSAPGWNEYLASASEAAVKVRRAAPPPSRTPRLTAAHTARRTAPPPTTATCTPTAPPPTSATCSRPP